MTVDKGRLVASQPERGAGDVVRNARSLDRLEIFQDALEHGNDLVRLLGGQPHRLPEDWGGDASWTDAVHANAVLAQLHGHRMCEMDDGGLGGAIDVGPEARAEPRHTGGADDGARALPLHHRRG